MEKINSSNKLNLTARVFKEGRTFVAHNPELDVASCGKTASEARANLRDAVAGFMKSAYRLGTLGHIL